jgi:hypothetical protein
MEMIGREIYIRTRDCNGHFSVSAHRVWDGRLFLEARMTEAAQENAKQLEKAPDSNPQARVEEITRAQYLQLRK